MAEYDIETGEVHSLPAVPESRPQNLIFASNECGEVFGALATMQGTMDAPKRTKKAKVKGRTRTGGEYEYEYTYAPLDEIINTIKKPMADAGLAYRQFLSVRGGNHVMRTIIAHKSGQWIGGDYPIIFDETRGMQGFASGVTYARRYGLMLALGIAAEDDDDANVADGNVATIASGRTGRPPAREAARPAATSGNRANPPPARPSAPARAPAAQKPPVNPEAAKNAEADWRAMRAAIGQANGVDEITLILESNDWSKLHEDIAAIDGAEVAIGVMRKLAEEAEKKRGELATGFDQ